MSYLLLSMICNNLLTLISGAKALIRLNFTPRASFRARARGKERNAVIVFSEKITAL